MSQASTNSTIIRQLQIVFGISIIILLISSYGSFHMNRKLIDASRLVNHTNEVIINAENLLSKVKDAETGQRGFIITNDSVFLVPYNGAEAATMATWNKLKEITVDNPLQQRNLDDAIVTIKGRFKQMAYVLSLTKSISGRQRTSLYMGRHEEVLKGKRIMDQLRETVKAIEDEERQLLKKRTDEQETYNRSTSVMIIVAAIISILISIMAYFRIKNELTARVKKQLEDEQKYLETARRINAMEDVTRNIAEGNYTVRSVDDAKDELGRISAALNEMAISLEGNFAEFERRDWLQTGVVNLGNSIRGERLVPNISDKIIKSLATYFKAPVGTLYIADKHLNLTLKGRYAAVNAPELIMAGKGLVGQAVQSREIFISDSLPADYIQITSSIGSSTANYTIILPFMHGDVVVGVLELGMLTKPTEAQVFFLKSNAEAIAISIDSVINYEKMQELLEETRAQSEELQMQHNELESINAELEIQTEKLQASEEELRVQQEELQQANRELEERSQLLEEKNQQIYERNVEVQRKAEELAVSTKYKSEFLANMSHELRTPLNSILLLSRLLSENGEDNLSEDQVEFARVIQSSGNALLTLIDEILDLSKIEAGKMNLEYDKVSVAEIENDIRSLFEPLTKEKKLQFGITVESSVPEFIETDKMRLEQILKNLLSNALKFTKTGSINLHISRDFRNADNVVFSVSDTGIGIAEDKQLLIFEAFQQADGSTRRKYGGTGLGLSISKELTKLLGGILSLTSVVDKGSTFAISVPLTEASIVRKVGGTPEVLPDIKFKTARDQKEDDHGNIYDEYIVMNIPESIPDDRAGITNKDKVILIVEDDTNFAKSLLDFTRKKGYKAIVCVRGDEALALAGKYLPVGILLDIQLPVKSGWQVMEELKGNAKTKHIPVHIMSSHSVKKESMLKGAINFINKPVAFEQMHDIFGKLEYVVNRDSKKVLIVEENPKHAKALAYFLETFDIKAHIKTTVSESVEALTNEVDCVILDMCIPNNSSYEILDQVKKTPGLENLPIIVFTGKSLSMAEEQRIKKYADSIVVKTAHSYQRILDEVSLFLHLVEEAKVPGAKDSRKKIGVLSDILKEKTVLIVDDDVRNIFSLTKALETVNMQIIAAIDGKEAMEKLQQNPKIDIVLLDMMMPQMDGYETARRIRQQPEWKRLPVIAVTAKAMSGDREKCIQAGASDYITKPVDVDQLLSLLRVWLYEKSLNTNSSEYNAA
ncbi:MAG: response regulator [Taibaiella sp.]|nr:response regulator [Taibaiella sp.]